MIPGLPPGISLLFILTVLLTIAMFGMAVRSRPLLYLTIGWLLVLGILSYNGFFLRFDSLPPRIFLSLIVPLVAIGLAFLTSAGRRLLATIPLRGLVIVSIVRVPVEIVLYLLYRQGQVPELMTFAGRNFDMLAGLSAPLMYFLCFSKVGLKNKRLLIGWHLLALGLLLHIVILALLSAPLPFQQLALDRPNRAVFYFPFVWLPGYIVMVVLFSHLVSLRALLSRSADDH